MHIFLRFINLHIYWLNSLVPEDTPLHFCPTQFHRYKVPNWLLSLLVLMGLLHEYPSIYPQSGHRIFYLLSPINLLLHLIGLVHFHVGIVPATLVIKILESSIILLLYYRIKKEFYNYKTGWLALVEEWCCYLLHDEPCSMG